LWVAAALVLLGLAALVFGGSRDPGALMVLLCVVAAVLVAAGALLAIWAIGYQRLVYSLTDSALRIEWLGKTMAVPYPAIQGIYTGQRLEGHATPDVPCWPGINVGPARVRGLGRLRFFATSTDQDELTFVAVHHGGVIVSARDPHEFRAALIDHVEQCEDVGVEMTTWQQTPPTSAPWTALADGWLHSTLAAGTLLLLIVVAVIAFRYESLPEAIALHFDASGQPNLISPRADLFRLPLLGLACLLVNAALGVWLHPRERLLARLLWLGAAVVQLVLLVGVLRVVG
jgi:hypothetical protein